MATTTMVTIRRMAMMRTSAGVLALILAGAAQAAEWRLEPTLYVGGSYTDNLQLTPDSQKVDEFVTRLSPGIKIGGVGKRFEVEFDYSLQRMMYSSADEFDETLNFARTAGTLKVLGDSLFMNFSGALNQQIINPNGRIGISTSSATGNRSEVGQFSVNPYYQRQLGSTSAIRIGYRYGFVEYDAPLLTDSENNGVFVNLSGRPPGSSFSWRADASATRIDYDTGSEVDLRRVGVELAYLFSSNVTAFVSGGDENNDFSFAGAPKIDGAYWNFGLRGKLDRLTEYEISAGEQHFGDSYGLSLLREAGKLTTDISYFEETTTVGRQQQGYEALFQFLTDVLGVELPGAPERDNNADVYVRKRWSISSALELKRSRLRLNAYVEDREYLTNELGDDGVEGVALSWTWTAAPRTKLSLDVGWQKFDQRDGINQPEDIRTQLRVNRDFRNEFFADLRIYRNVRSATVSQGEYEENAASIGFGKRF